MGFESRHRDDAPVQEDLADELARAHRLERAHSRDVLRRAEHAAAGDPQARSVRQWFAFLVDEEARAPATVGKWTLLETPQDDRSTPAQRHTLPAPGRQTLVLREERSEDVPPREQRRELSERASRELDVAQEWRTSQASGLDLSGVTRRRDGRAAVEADAHRTDPSVPGALTLDLRLELARGSALQEVVLVALDALASGRLSDGSLISSLLSPPPRPMTPRGAASLPGGQLAKLDSWPHADRALMLGGQPFGSPYATSGSAALADVAHRRAVTIFRRELADDDVDLHDPAIGVALQRTRQGEPLPESVRREMESRLGADFRHVRIHTDAIAATAAESLHSSAFTLGEDVFFAAGAFDPSGEVGQRLLVHELTHVVQAQQGRVPTSHGTSVSRPTDALEQEASAAYDRIPARGALPDAPAPAAPNVLASAAPDALAPAAPTALASAAPDALAPAAPTALAPAASPRPHESRMLLRGPGTPGAAPGKPGVSKAPGRDVSWLSWDAKLMLGFIEGFARTSGKGFTPEALAKIERDFKDPVSLLLISFGVQDGVPAGALQSLADNIAGLAQVAQWLFWNAPGIKEAKDLYELIKDPLEKLKREQEKRERQQAFIQGMRQFVVQLAADPGIIADVGEELGQAAGDYVARFFRETFANANPFEKGRMIGKGIGYVAMEIATLFVGPEVLVAKIPAAIAKLGRAGGMAAQAFIRLMQKIPALRQLLKAAGWLDKAAGAMGPEAKLLAHLEESIVTKVLQQGLRHDEIARLAKLDKTAAEKLLHDLPAKDVLELEQKLGKAELEKLANSGKSVDEIKAAAIKMVRGETSATRIGKQVHKRNADARRLSGEWDEVNTPIRSQDGKPIQVPKRVNKAGEPATPQTQYAQPDAVSYKRGEILDDKPVGRPLSKDRQEMIRNIEAYRQRTGQLPNKIIIERYDPATGNHVSIETHSPYDFLPR